MAQYADAYQHPSTYLTRIGFVSEVEAQLIPFEDNRYAIGYLHVANLKHHNRIHGIEAGDAIVHHIIALLGTSAVSGLVGRYAGDGFTFVVPADAIDPVAQGIIALVAEEPDANDIQPQVGFVVCHRPLSPAECIERARFACMTLARSKNAAYRLFDGELELVFAKRAYVVDHLDAAIAHGEIHAYAQPIVRVLTGRVCEVEILARWESERFGFLRPDEFVPELEHHALIHKLDLEIVRLACEQWREMRACDANVPFGINLSRLDFELCDIYANVRAVMDRYGVPVDQVHIEVTESATTHDANAVLAGVRQFQDAGFVIYMDDFGTGYSSLGTLANLHFDVIKIDKSLVDHVEDDQCTRSVLADTVSMIKRLGMQTLCEGVETPRQLEFLRAIGCEKAQGYLFRKPVPNAEIMRALQKEARDHERSYDDGYYDAIGQINLLDGTSAAVHGIEAAPFFGHYPVAILEFDGPDIRMLTCNIAYTHLLERMGFADLPAFVAHTMAGSGQVNARAIQAARRSKETGEEQFFTFIVNDVYCSASLRFVAESHGREAYLNTVTTVDNAPQITDRTLLRGLLDGSDRIFFWKDVNHRLLGVNQAFLDYYGFQSLSDVLGKTDEDIGWVTDDVRTYEEELRVLAGESIQNAPNICVRRGELRDIISTKRPLYSQGEIVGLVGYFVDKGPHQGTGSVA